MWKNLSFSRRISFYILGIVILIMTLSGVLYFLQEFFLWRLEKKLSLYENTYNQIEEIRTMHLRWKENFLISLLNEDLSSLKPDESVNLLKNLKNSNNFEKIIETGEKMNAVVAKMAHAKSLEEAISYYNEFQKFSKLFLWEGLENLFKHYEDKLQKEKREYVKIKRILQIIYFLTIIPVGLVIFLVLKAIENTIKENLSKVEDYTMSISQGDLSKEISIKRSDEFGRIFECLNRINQTLRSLLGILKEDAHKVYTFTEKFRDFQKKVFEKTENTSHRSQHLLEQASLINITIEDSATATNEITKAIEEISHNTSYASQITKEAVAKTEETKNVMDKLNEEADKISEVINLISGIAEQTKFLALNASIEAARAGEAGKGFAVVAGEVKELAKKVSEATLDVTERIRKIQEETKKAVKETGEVMEIINRINEVATSIASAIEEQSIAIKNIADQIEHTRETAKFMAEDAKQNYEAAEEIKKFIELQAEQIQELVTLVNEIKAQVGRFKL
ncbi:MAG: methyl-accepting chemotaxis protein [Caldimicrobium sp.]